MIRYWLFLAAGLPITLFFSLVAVAGGLAGAPAGWHDWVHRWWSRALLLLAGVEVEVRGLEHVDPERPLVVMANHQSLLDIPALLGWLPVSLRFVAKRELSRYPVFSAAMRGAGHVFIDRTDPAQAVGTMEEAARRMSEEHLALGLFPEGTRSSDGRLRRFRRGAFALAVETQTAVVPVAVEGGWRLLPKGRRRLVPGRIRIRCAPPIDLEGLSREDRDEVLRRTRSRIEGMLEELRPADRPAVGSG